MAATQVDPYSPSRVLANMRRRFGLVHRIVCDGHQCLDASMTALGGERPMPSALGLYKSGRGTPLPQA
jgi:hypothetical protein